MRRSLFPTFVLLIICLATFRIEAQLFTFNFDDQNLDPAPINIEPPIPINVSSLSFSQGSYSFAQDPAGNYNLELNNNAWLSLKITPAPGYVINLSHIYWEEMSTAEISPRWLIEVYTLFDGERGGVLGGSYTMELTRENSLPTWTSHDWALSQVPAYQQVKCVEIYFGILPYDGGPGPMLFDNFVLTGSIVPVPELNRSAVVAALLLFLWATFRRWISSASKSN